MKVSLELEIKPPQGLNFIVVTLNGKEVQVDVADLSEEDLLSVTDAWFHAFYENVNERRKAKGLAAIREPNSLNQGD